MRRMATRMTGGSYLIEITAGKDAGFIGGAVGIVAA